MKRRIIETIIQLIVYTGNINSCVGPIIDVQIRLNLLEIKR